jgi:putative Mg2+ transporter-C (MgtC) family protein
MDLERLVVVLLALLLGGLIGLEREWAGKPAGLRTNMLVAGASAFLVELGDLMVERFLTDTRYPSLVRIDSIRIVEAVVTGVSFIGAGTIIQRGAKLEVEGLTTAATLLFTASVGMAVALDAEWLAVSVTAAVLATLRVVGILEGLLPANRQKADHSGGTDPPLQAG